MDLECNEFDSYIRGIMHTKIIWTPVVGESLLLRREPDNSVDSSAVAVLREDQTVGHVPFNISSVISQFLRREGNQGLQKLLVIKSTEGLDMAWKSPVPTSSMAQDFTFRD